MDRLWKLDEKEKIQLLITEATDEEMQQAPFYVRNRLKDKINSRIFALDKIGTQEEKIRMIEIKRLLFPNKYKLNQGEERDVRNLFCAQKYGCNMFITVDKKHLLSKANLIKRKLNMDIFLPSQCLKIILDKLKYNNTES